MKTIQQIRELIAKPSRVDAHVHTHLCDGASDMTVQNIADMARSKRIDLVVLVPHFHRKLTDATETLYEDTDETIFLQLRDEIDFYSRHGDVQFLLSTEADILSIDGELSLSISSEAEKALDLITPTMNFSPLLPYRMVHLTSAKDRDRLHTSGEYLSAAEGVGGITAVLQAMYTCEANALLHSPYPCMLGHFFAAHSLNGDHSWFGIQRSHVPLITAGANKVIDACKRSNALLDITGLRFPNMTVEDKKKKDGFLYEFQKHVIDQCALSDVPALPGSDAHTINQIGEVSYYYEAFRL